MPRQTQSFHLRLDVKTHADLKQIAKDNERSLSAQIQFVLNQYIREVKGKN